MISNGSFEGLQIVIPETTIFLVLAPAQLKPRRRATLVVVLPLGKNCWWNLLLCCFFGGVQMGSSSFGGSKHAFSRSARDTGTAEPGISCGIFRSPKNALGRVQSQL